ncbi:hypothetical protein JKP88DRAFT_246189 [Tribonema minus]|uniref:Uncharacterized protein n=1 Tax=Tribonema minus TaxID=303371 RepID=A0A835YVV3_9STRA|nr:hypothetical protein JKP88DRAFT_246189 [Tribonema minus]
MAAVHVVTFALPHCLSTVSRIVPCNEKVKGKTLAEYGSAFWAYVAGTDNTKLAYQLNTAKAEQYLDVNMPERVILLGGLFCTEKELTDAPKKCSGAISASITRTKRISLQEKKYLYVPLFNAGPIADTAFCESISLDPTECKNLLLQVCFDDTDPSSSISVAKAALSTQGAITSSVNGQGIQKSITITADAYLLTFVDENVRSDVVYPDSPKGELATPYFACSVADAYMIEVTSPGTLTVKLQAKVPFGANTFYVGPVTGYGLTLPPANIITVAYHLPDD